MRVKNRAGATRASHSKMKKRLRRGFADTTEHLALCIDFEKMLRLEGRLVDPRSRDQQAHRFALQYRAEIAAGAQHPATAVERTAGLCERRRELAYRQATSNSRARPPRPSRH